MAHREPVEVVFADVDMMGHVNNAAYFRFFETARTRYFLHLQGLHEPPWRPRDLFFIVASASCEYKRALRWGERLDILVWPSHVGRTSFTLEYAIMDGSGAVAARGRTVVVTFDYERNAKKAIPDVLRSKLEADQAAGAGVPGVG